jgi:NAD(P)-dependent dehydrogenase (short-subunit alcohol dehydrogenase family)
LAVFCFNFFNPLKCETPFYGFEDKVVLITGSSSGIGRVTAIEFAKRGAQVIVTGRNETRIGQVMQECDRVSPKKLKALGIAADINVDPQVRRMFHEIERAFGTLDVLVNNAGATGSTLIEDPNLLQAYDHIVGTNLRGTLSVTREAVPLLVQNKGNIVITASRAGHVPSLQRLIYGSSKAALLMLTKNLALELGPKGVRVNSISPGVTNTTFDIEGGITAADGGSIFDEYKRRTVLGRIGQPLDMAEAIVFLASDRASFITGTDLLVDGGRVLT